MRKKLQVRKVGNLDLLRDVLDDLVMRSRTGTVFQTWEWQKAWWENYGEGEMEILETRSEKGGPSFAKATAGKLVGIGVFERLGKVVKLAGGERTDFMDIAALAGKEKEVWESFLDYFKEEGIEELDLQFVRENSPTFNFFSDFCRSSDRVSRNNGSCHAPSPKNTHKGNPSWGSPGACHPPVADLGGFYRLASPACSVIHQGVAPFLVLPKSWEEYLNSLDHHQRKEIKRKIKKLEEKGFEVRHFGQMEDLRKMMGEFITLYKKSSLEKEKSMDERKEKFYRQLVDLMGPKNWLELSFLYMQGKPVAGYISFVFKNELLLYNAGLDRGWNEWSPGTALLTLMIKREIEKGRQKFDFLRGGERYKYDLGGVDQKLYRIKLML